MINKAELFNIYISASVPPHPHGRQQRLVFYYNLSRAHNNLLCAHNTLYYRIATVMIAVTTNSLTTTTPIRN